MCSHHAYHHTLGDSHSSPTRRSSDLWARAFVISAGVIMNMLFAFVVYAAVFGIWGIPELESTRIGLVRAAMLPPGTEDRKSTRLNSSHLVISYAVFCLKKKIHNIK